jgi:hypothetical protein
MYTSATEVCKIEQKAIRWYLYSIGVVISTFVRYIKGFHGVSARTQSASSHNLTAPVTSKL